MTAADRRAASADEGPGRDARLHVREGRQAGAVEPLPHDRDIDVGNELDDAVFVDACDGARWRVTLRCTDEALRVTLRDGEAAYGGETLVQGETLELDYGAPLTGDGIALVVERAARSVPPPGRTPDGPASLADGTPGPAANDAIGADAPTGAWRTALARAAGREAVAGMADGGAAGTTGALEAGQMDAAVTRARTSPGRTGRWAALGIAIALCVGGALLQGTASNRERERAVREADDARRTLVEAARPYGVTLGEDDTLRGAVPSREAYNALRALAARMNPVPRVALQIDDELAGSVRDVYRVHGVDAEVRVLGVGEVAVTTSAADPGALELVERALAEDLPSIVSLTRTDRAPDGPVVDVSGGDPDRRVVLVVDGDGDAGGYLVTRDGSRYRVGSTLPSGHELERIEGGSVFATRDGTTVELRF